MALVFSNGYLIDTDAKYTLPDKTVRYCPHGCATDDAECTPVAMELIAGATVIPGVPLPEDRWGNPRPLSANFYSCPRCGHCEGV